MIISNLEALLKERKLKISKVAADTGISRTTLTALCNNTGKGVQFDTANMLCIYLNIGMDRLFTSIPFDITVEGRTLIDSSSPYPEWEVVFHLKYFDRKRTEFPNLVAWVIPESFSINPDGDEEDFLDIHISPLAENCKLEGEFGNSEEENELLRTAFASMPEIAVQIVKDRIGRAAIDGTSYTKAYVELPDELKR